MFLILTRLSVVAIILMKIINIGLMIMNDYYKNDLYNSSEESDKDLGAVVG